MFIILLPYIFLLLNFVFSVLDWNLFLFVLFLFSFLGVLVSFLICFNGFFFFILRILLSVLINCFLVPFSNVFCFMAPHFLLGGYFWFICRIWPYCYNVLSYFRITSGGFLMGPPMVGPSTSSPAEWEETDSSIGSFDSEDEDIQREISEELNANFPVPGPARDRAAAQLKEVSRQEWEKVRAEQSMARSPRNVVSNQSVSTPSVSRNTPESVQTSGGVSVSNNDTVDNLPPFSPDMSVTSCNEWPGRNIVPRSPDIDCSNDLDLFSSIPEDSGEDHSFFSFLCSHYWAFSFIGLFVIFLLYIAKEYFYSGRGVDFSSVEGVSSFLD